MSASIRAEKSRAGIKYRVQLWHAAAGLLVLCALFMFVPMSDSRLGYRSETIWHVTQDQMIPAEKVHEEFQQIKSKASELSERGELTPELIFGLQKRLERITAYAEQRGPNPRPGRITWDGSMKMQLANIRDGDPKFRKLSKEDVERYTNFFDTDPEWLALYNFRASTTVGNIWSAALLRYMVTIPFGVLACILLMLEMRRPLSHALSSVFGHPFLMALYPFGLMWVLLLEVLDRESYEECTQRIVSWLGYGTAASLSLFCGGTASAQSIKKEEKRKSSGHTLQLDTRVIEIPGAAPPFVFNRTTMNAKKWLTESITTITPKTHAWYHETGVGAKLIRTARTTMSLMGVVSRDSTGKQKVMAGMQYFHARPTYVIAIPVMRVEKTFGGPKAVAVAPNPFFRLGGQGILNRLGFSPDVLVRKTFGKPLVWTAGLGVDVFLRKGKSDRAEAALLRTSAGQWQIRGRWICNFAY